MRTSSRCMVFSLMRKEYTWSSSMLLWVNYTNVYRMRADLMRVWVQTTQRRSSQRWSTCIHWILFIEIWNLKTYLFLTKIQSSCLILAGLCILRSLGKLFVGQLTILVLKSFQGKPIIPASTCGLLEYLLMNFRLAWLLLQHKLVLRLKEKWEVYSIVSLLILVVN